MAELKKQQSAAKAAAAQPKAASVKAAARRPKKPDNKPKVELTAERKRKCYMWYARLGQPNRAQMLQHVRNLKDKNVDITEDDVWALPWILGGSLLPVKEMNDLFMNG